MRLDDKEKLQRGIFKYWFECDRCNVGCTLNGVSGEISWNEIETIGTEDDLPF